MKRKNKNFTTSTNKDITFVIWFIASIILFAIFSKIQICYALMIFGQLFVGLSIYMKNFVQLKTIYNPFFIVGILLIIIPLIILITNYFSITINWGIIIVILMMAFFLIMGVSLILIPFNNNKIKEECCTVSVPAKIVRLKISEDSSSRCPVYEIYFNNKLYQVSDNCYRNYDDKTLNTIVELKINPDNPNEFINITKSKSKNILLFLLIGLPFILLPITFLIIISRLK